MPLMRFTAGIVLAPRGIGTMVAMMIVVIVASGETNATFNYLREGIGGWYTGR